MRHLLAASLVMVAGAASGQTSNQDKVDTATFRAICGSCHSTTLVEGLRTEEEWREEVDQMIKIGARGTEEQFRRVMRVLLRTLTKVNVNTAEARLIATVLDLSEDAAEELVKRRASKGKFQTIEDLRQIPGVDATKLEARKDRLLF